MEIAPADFPFPETARSPGGHRLRVLFVVARGLSRSAGSPASARVQQPRTTSGNTLDKFRKAKKVCANPRIWTDASPDFFAVAAGSCVSVYSSADVLEAASPQLAKSCCRLAMANRV